MVREMTTRKVWKLRSEYLQQFQFQCLKYLFHLQLKAVMSPLNSESGDCISNVDLTNQSEFHYTITFVGIVPFSP